MELYYHPVSPPARACELTAKFLKLDVKVTTLDLFKGEQMKPEFVALNPAHCVPTLTDGDFVLWESRAIMQYMANKTKSPYYPADPVARAKVDSLLCWDMGELYASIMAYQYPLMGFKPMPKNIGAMETNFRNKLAFLDEHLVKGPYLTGDAMTIADMSIAVSLTMPEIISVTYEKYPNISAWLGKMHAHDEWKEVQAKFEGPKKEFQDKLASQQSKF